MTKHLPVPFSYGGAPPLSIQHMHKDGVNYGRSSEQVD